MLLLDNSAWARLSSPKLPRGRLEEVAAWFEQGEVAVSLPFLLEAGYSARSSDDFAAIVDELLQLPRVEVTPEIEQLALDAHAALARIGHHRVPPSDLVIAACAHCDGAGILHYDRDYDVLADSSGLAFESVWLAPAGEL